MAVHCIDPTEEFRARLLLYSYSRGALSALVKQPKTENAYGPACSLVIWDTLVDEDP